MELAEYVQEVHRTCSITEKRDLLTMSALGLAGESGEIVDLLKKVLYHGHALNREQLRQELGDLLWYLVLLCETCELTLDEVMQANVAKLRARYPQGFETHRSQNREVEEDGK